MAYRYFHMYPPEVFDSFFRQLFIAVLLIPVTLCASDADGNSLINIPSVVNCSTLFCGLLPWVNFPDLISLYDFSKFSPQVISCILLNEYPFESSNLSNEGANNLLNPDFSYDSNNSTNLESLTYLSLNSDVEYKGSGRPFFLDLLTWAQYIDVICPNGVLIKLRLLILNLSDSFMYKYTNNMAHNNIIKIGGSF